MADKVFKIFIDFDGTITKRDIGEAMFMEFGNPARAEEIVKDWIDEKINASQSWQLLCSTVKNLDLNSFNKFIDTIGIDDFFKIFVDYCSTNNYEIRILSDGLDYYINRFLKKENLQHLELFSNRVVFDESNNMTPVFPYTDEECKRCANCKRNHILNNSADDENEYSVYIGDGWSDVCPAQYCDFIFAKSSLLKYCESNRITYFPYSNFDDVITKLNQLKEKKRLKKRHQAQLKRREVYIQG